MNTIEKRLAEIRESVQRDEYNGQVGLGGCGGAVDDRAFLMHQIDLAGCPLCDSEREHGPLCSKHEAEMVPVEADLLDKIRRERESVRDQMNAIAEARAALAKVMPPTPEADNPLYYPLLFLVNTVDVATPEPAEPREEGRVYPGREWLERMAKLEDEVGGSISVGGLASDVGLYVGPVAETGALGEPELRDLLTMWAKADEERGADRGGLMPRHPDWLDARIRMIRRAQQDDRGSER